MVFNETIFLYNIGLTISWNITKRRRRKGPFFCEDSIWSFRMFATESEKSTTVCFLHWTISTRALPLMLPLTYTPGQDLICNGQQVHTDCDCPEERANPYIRAPTCLSTSAHTLSDSPATRSSLCQNSGSDKSSCGSPASAIGGNSRLKS